MAIKTPVWWYRKDAKGSPWWRPALMPLSGLWLGVNAVKRATAKPYRSNLFVISIGNVTLGGSGKTPVTGALLDLLAPAAIGLSRGHGGSLEGPVRVDPATHTAAEVGDEPLMLAQGYPFVIARDRAEGLRFIAEARGKKAPRIVIVDDAHQNLKIAKDLHILVVDGDTRNGAWPFGDGGVVPAGPMREPLAEGLKRADCVVLWMPDAQPPAPDLLDLFGGKPVFIARLAADPPAIPSAVFGFAGIAKPWKFQATLEACGYDIAGFKPLPDHASLTASDLDALQVEAGDARLITTEKDWIKLDAAWRKRVVCVPIRAVFEDEKGLSALIATAQQRKN